LIAVSGTKPSSTARTEETAEVIIVSIDSSGQRSGVRGEDHIRHLAKPIGDVRFVLEDIETGAGELPGFQSRDKRPLVDRVAAAGVDDQRTRLHAGEHLRVE